MSLLVLPNLQAVDFMAEAKEVIALNTLLSGLEKTSEGDPLSQEVLRIIDKELNIVFKHFQELPVDCVVCSALRTRLEHVVRMVHLFLNKCDEAQTQSLTTLTLLLLFELLKILEQRVDSQHDEESQDHPAATDAATAFTEKELRKHYEEKNMGAGRTQWAQMCFTSVALTLVAMLRKVPSAYALLDLNLADSISLTLSPHWQMQCLGLRIVCSLLQSERVCDIEAVSGNSNPESGGNRRASGIAEMQRRIDSFNNSSEDTNDINKAASSVTGLINRGKSSKLSASTDPSVANSRKERRTSINKLEHSSSSQKLTRVSTSAGNGATSTADGSFTTAKMESSSKGNRSTSLLLRKSVSSIQQGSFRALVQTNRAARCVDDICKSGYLRTIVALLMHNKEIIRKLAAEVLQLIMDISTTNPSTSNNKDDTDPAVATFVTDICACCVEQGLVPQLEYVQQGILIYRNPSTTRNNTISDTEISSIEHIHTHIDTTFCFPEASIRTQCTTLLHHLVQEVEKHTSLLSRLTSAMLHSGNTKLRVNTFSGFMYLTGRCPEIGRRLCEPVPDPAAQTNNTPSQNNSVVTSVSSAKSAKVDTTSTKAPATTSSSNSNSSKTKEPSTLATTVNSTPESNSVLTFISPRRTLFYDMLTTLSRDVVDFRNLLHVVMHFMEHTLTLQQEMQANNVPGSNNSCMTPTAMNQNPLLYKIEPMVLISDQTRVTRMICPPLNVIEQHSTKLASLVKTAMETQVAIAIQSVQSSTRDTSNHRKEKQLMQALKNMDDSLFVTLQGSYNVWQEIFSHMSDGYLLQTSVPKISTIGLLECLFITTQFEMRTLGGKYSEALVQRLDNNNFIQIFRASVGLYFPPKVIVPSIISAKTSTAMDGATDIDSTPLALHLYQALHCMKYLDTNMERVITIWKPKDTTLIVDCVHRIVLSFFLIEE